MAVLHQAFQAPGRKDRLKSFDCDTVQLHHIRVAKIQNRRDFPHLTVAQNCCRQVMHNVRLFQQWAADGIFEFLSFQGSQERRRKVVGTLGGLILCDVSTCENYYLHVLSGSGAENLLQPLELLILSNIAATLAEKNRGI